MKPARNIRKTAFWLGVALPSFALIATVWVTALTNGQFNGTFASVTHTYKVLNLLEDAQSRIADAETGQRGFLLTKRADYSTLHGAAISAINSDIEQLRILIGGNAAAEKDLDRLQNLVASRLNFSSVTNLPADQMAVALTDQGRDTIRQFRQLLFEMRQEETDLLAQRQQNAEKQFLFDQTASFVLVAVTAIALLAVIAIVMRLEHLRRIVTVCAWTGQVKDGTEWVRLEDYLKKRFGVSVSHGVSKEAADKMVQEMRHSKEQGAP